MSNEDYRLPGYPGIRQIFRYSITRVIVSSTRACKFEISQTFFILELYLWVSFLINKKDWLKFQSACWIKLKFDCCNYIGNKLCITALPVIFNISSFSVSVNLSFSLCLSLFSFSLSLYLSHSLSLSVCLSLIIVLTLCLFLCLFLKNPCSSKFCNKMLAAAAPSLATKHL